MAHLIAIQGRVVVFALQILLRTRVFSGPRVLDYARQIRVMGAFDGVCAIEAALSQAFQEPLSELDRRDGLTGLDAPQR